MKSAHHFSSRPWLQQYGRGAFFHSAHCSFSNPICFWSVWCRRTMIPRKLFTSFAKFWGIVSVNDSRLPIRLQELLQAPFGFLRSFCFARIRLDPLGGQVLHHDCISMIVSRFTIFTENFVICCCQVTKIFCTKYDSANASSARSPCDFGPLAGLAISVLGKWILTLSLPTSHWLWWSFMSRTGVWASVFRNPVIHKILSELLQPLLDVRTQRVSPLCRNNTGLPVPARDSHFSLVLGFWLFFLTTLLMFQKNTGLPVLVYPHFHLTQFWMAPVLVYPHFPLTRLLEGDLNDQSPWRCHGYWGWWAWGRRRMINFLPWRITDVEQGKLEEELVDEPGTIIATCFTCNRPLAVMTIVGLHDFVKVSISAPLKSFLPIMCIDAPESTTNPLSSG